MVMELLIHLKSKISSSFLETVLKPSAVMTCKTSNTVARKSFSFRRKTITKQGNEKLFLTTVFEFVYVITALVFSIENQLKIQ